VRGFQVWSVNSKGPPTGSLFHIRMSMISAAERVGASAAAAGANASHRMTLVRQATRKIIFQK
jgi:hypothetical protein